MPSTAPSPTALFAPLLLWADVATQTSEMLLASGQVIGSRVHQIARAGARPSARDRREFALMGTEKVKAATESALAVVTRLQATHWQWFARAWDHWFASMAAFGALASSRTPGEMVSRQARLVQALGRSTRAQAQLSGETARLAAAALKPVHAASTANARRLARSRGRVARRS
jgi:hypothetical protein